MPQLIHAEQVLYIFMEQLHRGRGRGKGEGTHTETWRTEEREREVRVSGVREMTRGARRNDGERCVREKQRGKRRKKVGHVYTHTHNTLWKSLVGQ